MDGIAVLGGLYRVLIYEWLHKSGYNHVYGP